jgi:hypothetical protein
MLAEPEGYVRIFVDEGRPMALLLYEALAEGSIQSIFVGCWQRSLLPNLSKRHHLNREVRDLKWSSRSASAKSKYSNSSPKA